MVKAKKKAKAPKVAAPTSIKMVHAALDTVGEDIVLRGVVHPKSLDLIQAGPYQREVLKGRVEINLIKSIQREPTGVPDVILGMRGEQYLERDGAFYLHDPVFVVDGLQRISAAIHVRDNFPDIAELLRVGATVHFSTTEDWERDRFHVLNACRTKVAGNIIIRNLRHDFPGIQMLYAMTEQDQGFALHGRVCWEQRMRRNDVTSASIFLKAAAAMHSGFAPGLQTRPGQLAQMMERQISVVGRNTFRGNIRGFWELIDDAWGIRRVVLHGAPHLRWGFIQALCLMFASHPHVFFNDNHFRLDARTLRKLKLFPINDPQISQLCRTSGQGSRSLLYLQLIRWMNSGRRTNRLSETARPRGEDPEAAAVA